MGHESWDYIKKKIRKPCLNVGCGKYIFENVDNLDNIEFPKYPIDIKEDFTHSKIPDNTYNSVLLLNVIEHVSSPGIFIQQSYRVLKHKGILIISAPFLTGIHRQPEDFWRFTKEGLIFLCCSFGFKLKEIEGYGVKVLTKIEEEQMWTYYRGVFIK